MHLALIASFLSVSQAPAPIDSLAGVARGLYRESVAAANRGAVKEARDLMARAHEAWPPQPAYIGAAAALSARLADTAATLRYLGILADMGLTRDLGGNDFVALREVPALASVRRRLAENAGSLVASRAILTLEDAELYPEGMDYDRKTMSYFVASIRKRKIVRIDAYGQVSDMGATDSLDAVLGVRVDSKRGVLWATTRALPQMAGFRAEDSGRAEVVAFDVEKGRVLGRGRPTAGETAHLFGDLTIHSSGDAYLTDSETPALYRARLVAGGRVVIEELMRDRLFRSLQGLTFADGERTLYVADYSHGLLAVDLAARTVRVLPAPPRTTIVGLDGITRYRRSIIAIQNGVVPPRVVRIDLFPDGDEIAAVTVLDRHLPVADEPTIGAIVGDRFVYVANSQWEKYDDQGRLKPNTRLTPPVLLALPLLRP